jgi:cold shock CspA family protein
MRKEATMLQGTVDRVDVEGRFGFIIGPNGEEYFFHQSALQGPAFEELAPGVTVVFNISTDPGDRSDEHLRAVDIKFDEDAIPAVDNETLPPEKIAE